MSALIESSADELIMIKSVLDRTFDANIFISAIESIYFRFESESPMGLLMESDHSRLLLKVKNSIHPTNIATLLLLDKASGKQTYLIDDGIREF
jgi:hypothetical protein